MATRGVNKVIIVGNLGRDPEVRYMTNGDAVTTISVATSEVWKDKQTGQQQERTEWHRIVFFRQLAQIAGQYLRKGSKVYLEGRLQTRKWQGQDGSDRYTTEIVANEMQMLDSRNTSQGGYDQAPPMGSSQFEQPQQNYAAPAQPQRQAPPQQQAPQQPAPQQQPAPATQSNQQFEDFDDDVPF